MLSLLLGIFDAILFLAGALSLPTSFDLGERSVAIGGSGPVGSVRPDPWMVCNGHYRVNGIEPAGGKIPFRPNPRPS